jgi:GNAT superfamily N-acetyltransferase
VTPAGPSPESLRAAAMFGLSLGNRAPSRRVPRGALGAVLESPAGSVVLLSGASGSGKSCLLDAVRTRLGVRAVCPTTRVSSAIAVIDAVARVGVRDPWAVLSACGLAEAALAVRPVGSLSEGERARLDLATALARTERRGDRETWVLLDEFASVLDRVTAAGVAATVRRWARRDGRVRVVAATAHADMARLLGPDRIIELGGARWSERPGPKRWRPGISVAIERGCITDFDALSHLHYRGGRPATWSRVCRAVGAGGELAGVLVASRPTLNAAWRDTAWPGRYRTGRRRADAMRVHRELRCISRVVVEPRYRGLGVARRLVEACLARSETPAVESVAAMGAVSPFFERAGMTRVPVERSAADWRLLDAFDAFGVVPGDRPWMLADERVRRRVLGDPRSTSELRRWARASGARVSERVRRGDDAGLVSLAATRLMASPVAFAWARKG